MAKRFFPEECMFVNCLYTYHYYNGVKVADNDSVILVWKDKNQNKGFTYIEDPSFSYYVTKDIEAQYAKTKDNPAGYEYRYISLDDVTKVTCKYNDLYSSMNKHTDRINTKKFYEENKKNKSKLREMHLFNEFHGTDANITDYYIDLFCQENDQEKYNYGISIGSFDIEVDGADYPGFPDEDIAPCPVNLITYYNTKTNTLTVFMLKYDTETFEEFTKRYAKQKVAEVKEKYNHYFKDFKIKAKIYDDELKLIAGFFNLVNTDKPDYNLAWNAQFDIITLHHRICILTGNPINDRNPKTGKVYSLNVNDEVSEIMCPKEFPIKQVYIAKDNSIGAKNDFTARTDIFNIYGYTVWLDMLPLYGNLTRPLGKKDSYSLNAIGLEETGMSKEDLSAEDTSIKTAHLDDYSLFFKYGCIDTMLLALIIKNTGFVDLLHTIVTLTRTRANKALTKTVCLRNYVNVFYREMGYTISNNRSSMHFFDKNGISGAYVAPPELIDLVGSINGLPSNKCFDLVIDEDLSSMYPNILITFNISSSTAEFRIIVKNHTGEYITVMKNGKQVQEEIIDDITKDFMEKYLSEDVVNFCHEFHNLPDYEEMYKLFAEA